MTRQDSAAEKGAAADALWDAYSKSGDMQLRNELVMQYANLVKMIALRMRGSYKNYAQVDDVVNQGIIALIDAVEKFDLTKGYRFETFATIKIKGAIIDYIRAQDWVPRRLRKMWVELEEAYGRLCNELDRQPTHKEIAKSLAITTEQLDRLMESTYNFSLLSYEEVIWQKMSGIGEDLISYNDNEMPEHGLMERELREQLSNAVEALNERERTVVSLYYYEKLKLKEIAEILGVSESRICQIHSAAILKMKKTMTDYIQV